MGLHYTQSLIVLVTLFLYAHNFSSYFTIIPVSNIIKETFVAYSNYSTNSILQCALTCARTASSVFLFDQHSHMCHCGNQTNLDVEHDTISNMSYGILTVNAMVRNGSDSECQRFYDTGVRLNGYFNINSMEVTVFCNFSSLGWRVFQRRMDGSINFTRNWTDYVNGFGDPDGEFWLGLETLHRETKKGCELHIYLEAEPGNQNQTKGYAKYSNFLIGGAEKNYTLRARQFAGNVEDSMELHTGSQFSTYDSDHDNSDGSCANEFFGGWWYEDCHWANLNGLYHYGYNTSFGVGINWATRWGHHYSLPRTEMAFRC